jgi:hypothetical protein
MSDPAVEFSFESIRQAWDAGGGGDLWLEFHPLEQTDHDLSVPIVEALADADAAATVEHGLVDEIGSTGPFTLVLGPRAYLFAVYGPLEDAHVQTWLDAFARALTGAGLTGRVVPMPRRRSATWDRAEKIPWPQLAMYSAYVLADSSRERIRDRRWNVDEATTARVAAEVERSAFLDADTFTWILVRQFTTTPHAVAQAMTRLLRSEGSAVAAHVRPDASRIVYIGHRSNGLVSRRLYDPSLSWQDRLLTCVDAMTALADITRLAFVQWGRGFNAGWDDLDQGTPPTAVPGYKFRYNPEVLDRFIPDARGALVVQDSHLERANDLSAWTTKALGYGRYLLEHPQPAAWYAQPDVDAAVLADARHDLGNMIITPADIDANERDLNPG